jgi:hypothetical protein
MVNAENQKLDGSSFRKYRTMQEMQAATIQRVIEGKKPMGVISFWAEERPQAEVLRTKLKKFTHLIISPLQPRGARLRLIIAHRGSLSELFDLPALVAWYRKNNLPDVAEDIAEKQNNKLTDYFRDWDWADEDSDVEPWETGLILGYPVQNTMRRCYGLQKVIR